MRRFLTRYGRLDLRPYWPHIWLLLSIITLTVFMAIGARSKEDYLVSILEDPTPVAFMVALMFILAGLAYLRLNWLFLFSVLGLLVGLSAVTRFASTDFFGFEGWFAVLAFSMSFGGGIAAGVVAELVAFIVRKVWRR